MHRTSGKISLILDFKVFQKCSIGFKSGKYVGKNINYTTISIAAWRFCLFTLSGLFPEIFAIIFSPLGACEYSLAIYAASIFDVFLLSLDRESFFYICSPFFLSNYILFFLHILPNFQLLVTS
jgi:hypothetical protein